MKYGQKIQLKVRIIVLLAMLVIAGLFFDTGYMNHLGYFRTFKLALYCITIMLEFLYALCTRVRYYKEYTCLVLYFVMIFLITIVKQGSLQTYITTFGSVISVCFIFIAVRSWNCLRRILKIWCFVFTLLLIADLVTIVLFPNGLYAGTYIRNNWFLGYKTNRLVYTFPLLVFTIIMEVKDLGRITRRGVLVMLLVIADTVLSRSTGAALAVLGFSVLTLLLFSGIKAGEIVKKPLKSILKNYPLILLVYFVLFLLTVVLTDSILVSRVVIGIFHKSFSFSERITIWGSIIARVRDNFLFGIGMQSPVQYYDITGGYANAHNTLLTYLLTGGVTSVFLLVRMIVLSVKKAVLSEVNYINLIFVYSIMFLGLTSSALAFCSFYFAIQIMPFNKEAIEEAG